MKKIIHCDADCFYAAVEIRDNPQLKGLPVAVGGKTQRRGVITTCSYEAREFGVRAAMPAAHALKLCPKLIILGHNMEKYRIASQQMREIFLDYTPLVEPLSLDEAYLDVTACTQLQSSATRIAKEIQARIYTSVGITVSAGVANSKYLAKIASDINKPNGIYTIPPKDIPSFLKTLPVKKLFGVGAVTQQKMRSLGLETCHDLTALSKIELVTHFGRFGGTLYHLCRGIDERLVTPNRIRKSISVEHTYHRDLTTAEQYVDAAGALFEELRTRIEKLDSQYIPQKPFAKLKFNDFTVTTIEKAERPITLESYKQLIREGASRQLKPIRLIGIGARLSTVISDKLNMQLPLF